WSTFSMRRKALHIRRGTTLTTTAPASSGNTAAPAFVQPNLFQLSGSGIHVSFSTSGIDGKPHFSYQDAHQTLSFTGDQIRQVPCDLGTLVSVTIRLSVDQGSTTFSLIVPHVNLPGEQTVPIRTEGITTVHRFSLVPAFNMGQLETYTVRGLHGTAAHVL